MEVVKTEKPSAEEVARELAARLTVKKEEEDEQQVKEEVEKTVTEEELRKLMLEQGFVPVKLVTFELPSEYRGMKTEYEVLPSGQVIEKRSLVADPRIYRVLRKSFYNVLNRIAYRTTMGWILFRKADKEYLDKLNEIINKFKNLTGDVKIVRILDIYMPRHVLEDYLRENIAEVRANLKEIREKIMTETLKKQELQRYKRKLGELQNYLKKLEQELKQLKQLPR